MPDITNDRLLLMQAGEPCKPTELEYIAIARELLGARKTLAEWDDKDEEREAIHTRWEGCRKLAENRRVAFLTAEEELREVLSKVWDILHLTNRQVRESDKLTGIKKIVQDVLDSKS